MKTCPKCHSENPGAAKYCMNCGSKLNNEELQIGQNLQNIDLHTIYFEANERIKETIWIRKNSIFHEFGNGKGNIRLKETTIEIGEDAFCGCNWLTTIVIPNSIITIRKNSFRNCQNLTSIIISNSTKEICESAFQGCNKLTSIVLPYSVTMKGKNIFKDCNMLPQSVVKDLQERFGCGIF